ncbi:DUF397 domain-containing protein [Nocardiopsis sp. JB363]|uniref:DUF397 domain-containing protein n=1 Tax=Nocardiopsis sp. JB363 TaxID=1434837 RepID=UPI000B35EE1F|nr:DUF397 domain-containing protein [Nocardiopsis sp. JB363]
MPETPHFNFHKSSYSGANNNCVEVRERSKAVDIRDTQHRAEGYLAFTSREWMALLSTTARA